MTTPPQGQQPQHPRWSPVPANTFGAPQAAPRPPALPPSVPEPRPDGVVGRHQAARPAMVLGIVSLVGMPLAGLSLLLAPFALALGLTARREIVASGGTVLGLDQARAGVVMGIVGTVLLVLVPVLLIGLAVVLALAGGLPTVAG